METLIITTKNKDNANFILKLVDKLGEMGKIIKTDEKEDVLLGVLMNEKKTGTKVSREEVFSRLKK